MNRFDVAHIPPLVLELQAQSKAINFDMGSDFGVGQLLRTLVASYPQGNFLELGTGTGLGTAWMLAGMDSQAHLTTIEDNPDVLAVAQAHLGQDPRLTVIQADAQAYLQQQAISAEQFDLIFADTWAGKFTDLALALRLVKPAGMYVIDDLLPQPNWPPNHQTRVDQLMDFFRQQSQFLVSTLAWASGVLIALKQSQPSQSIYSATNP